MAPRKTEGHDEQFTQKNHGRPQLISRGDAMHHQAGTIGRRTFLRRGAAGAAAACCAVRPSRATAEPPPEITKLRIVREPSICIAPQYAAEELLKAEGFVEVEYVQTQSEPYKATGSGWRPDGNRVRPGRPVVRGSPYVRSPAQTGPDYLAAVTGESKNSLRDACSGYRQCLRQRHRSARPSGTSYAADPRQP
jgi:hypothetical protein